MQPHMFFVSGMSYALGILILVLPQRVEASCPCDQNPPTLHIARSQWIVHGQIISIKRVPNNSIDGFSGRTDWSVRVRRHLSLKGSPPLEFDLLMLNDECQLNPQKILYQRLTFFAQPNGKSPYFHYCDVGEILKWRGELRAGPAIESPDYFQLLPGLSNVSSLKTNAQ